MNRDFIITKIDRIIYFREDPNTPGSYDTPPKLSSNELIFFSSGRKDMCFADKNYHIPPKSVHYLPKGDNKKYRSKRIEPADGYDIFFQTDVPLDTIAFVQNHTNRELIESLFKRSFQVWTARDEGYYFECISLLYKILALMQQTSYLPERKFSQIKPAVEHINEHFLEEINYEGLAKLCGISYSYFKRLFIERFGMSPQKYITNQRINYACDLLHTGKFSISTISELSGFKDVFYFSRIFKKQMGISPSKYKSQNNDDL